jgi:rod shape-determining protein MreD
MLRGLISFAVVGVAVIVQVTIVDRIAFPGGTGPDVVLLAVAALALAGGPLVGTLIGFWGGLALDVAPPGSHFVGENALVFCLIGYACGLAAEVPNREGTSEQGHTALFEIVITAAGAVCGEVLTAALGKMLSDPRISVPAVRHVLPVAAAYDVVLAPFVLYAAAAALRLAGALRGERDRAAWATPAMRSPAEAIQGAIRQVNGGNTPRLRLSERGKGEGLAGGLRGQGGVGLATAKREPRLKLSQTGSLGAAFATGARQGGGRAGTMAGALGGGARGGLGGASKVRFGTRRGEGTLGGTMLGGAMALNSNLARSRLNGSRFGRSRMGRSLLGGSVFSRPSSALRPSAPPRKSAPISRSSFLGHSPLLGRSSAFGHSPLLGRSSAFGRSPFLGRSSAFGRSPFLGRSSATGRSPAFGRSSAFGRTSAFGRSLGQRRTAGWRRSPAGSAAGSALRRSRPGLLTRLTGALRRPVRHEPRLRPRQPSFRPPIRSKSPGRGWLRRSSSAGRALGRGQPRRRTPRLGTRTPRLHMPRPGTKKRRRTGGYR